MANPNRSNRVMERFSRVVEVPQVRFYTAIDLLSGGDDGFGYQKRAAVYELTEDTEVDSSKTYYTRSGSGTSASPYVYTEVASPTKANLGTYYEMTTTPGLDINFMVVERGAVIKFDKHVASRVFSPDELESLDSYMMKYRNSKRLELRYRDMLLVTMQRQFDKRTVHSNNLYQIFAYVKNKEADLAEVPHEVSGMLLYARTDKDKQPDGVYQMSGNQISVRTLELSLSFEKRDDVGIVPYKLF